MSFDEAGNPITPSVYDPTSVGGGGQPLRSWSQVAAGIAEPDYGPVGMQGPVAPPAPGRNVYDQPFQPGGDYGGGQLVAPSQPGQDAQVLKRILNPISSGPALFNDIGDTANAFGVPSSVIGPQLGTRASDTFGSVPVAGPVLKRAFDFAVPLPGNSARLALEAATGGQVLRKGAALLGGDQQVQDIAQTVGEVGAPIASPFLARGAQAIGSSLGSGVEDAIRPPQVAYAAGPDGIPSAGGPQFRSDGTPITPDNPLTADESAQEAARIQAAIDAHDQRYGGVQAQGRQPITDAQRAALPESYRQTFDLGSDFVNGRDIPIPAEQIDQRITERLAALPRSATGDVRVNKATAAEQQVIGQMMAARDMRAALDAHGGDPYAALADLEQNWKDTGQSLEMRDTPQMRGQVLRNPNLTSPTNMPVSGNIPLPVLRAYGDALDTVIKTARYDPSVLKLTRSPAEVVTDTDAAYQRSIGNTAPLSPTARLNSPVENLIQRIQDAKPLEAQNQELVSQFRSRQAGAFAGAATNGVGGEAGARGALSAMRGQAERVTFQPLRDVLGQEQIDGLNDTILQHPDMRPFEKAQAVTALGHIIDGQVPTPSSLASLEDAFPGVTSALQKANIVKGPTIWQRLPTSLPDINNSIRSANTLMDFAFMGRLGPQAGVMQPGTFARAIGQAWKSVANPDVVENVWSNLDERAAASHGLLPTVDEMRTDYGLKAFTSDTNAGVLGNIPGVGRLAKVYQNFQALLRPQMLMQEIQNRLDSGALSAEDLSNPQVTHDLGRSINLLTGASSLNIGDDANLLFEFPNWLAAQGELIYRAATNGNITGQMARRSLLRLSALGTATTAAIELAQGRSPLADARNGVPMARIPDAVADRLGLKRGTTIDIFGAVGELASHVIGVGVGAVKGAEAGGVGGAAGGAASELGYQYRSLASPLASLGIDVATRTNFLGQPLKTGADWLHDLAQHVLPFNASSALEGGRSPAAQIGGSAGLRLHEPSSTAQLYQKVDEAFPPAERPYGIEPYMLDQVRKANPDLTSASLGRATEDTQAAVGAKARANQQQSALDDQLHAGAINPQAWRTQRETISHELSGALAQVYIDHPDTPADPSKPWQLYGQEIAKHTDKTRTVDWNAVDQWKAGLPASDQAAIDRNIGLNDTQTVKDYRVDAGKIADAGYWDAGDKEAVTYAKSMGLSGVTNRTQLLDALEKQVKSEVGPSAQAAVPTILNRLVAPYNKLVGIDHEEIIAAHPEIAGLLKKWGYSVPARAVALAGAQ